MKNRLKQFREEANMTQEELSKKSGVARTIISYLETEKDCDVKVSTLKSLSHVLGHSIQDIFFNEEVYNSKQETV